MLIGNGQLGSAAPTKKMRGHVGKVTRGHGGDAKIHGRHAVPPLPETKFEI